MPEKTSNFGLNLFVGSEPFDVGAINENYSNIDSLVMPYKTGIIKGKGTYGTVDRIISKKTGSFIPRTTQELITSESEMVVEWYYKKYTNKTIEFNTIITFDFSKVLITYGESRQYRSLPITLEMPMLLSEVYDIDLDIAGVTKNSSDQKLNLFKWPSVETIGLYDLKNEISFCVMANNKTLSTYSDFTAIFVEVKGVEL